MILCLAVAAAVAQPVDAQAAALFRAGEARYEKDDAAAALKLFEASYRLVPTPMLLVDIAQCQRKLGRPREAADAYRSFLESRSGGRRVRAEVFEALDELEARRRPPLVERPGARSRAGALFQRGRARYQAGDFQSALEAFRLALAELPIPDLYVNVAQCLRKLDRPEEAVLAYHAFLEASGAPRALRIEVWEALDETLSELDGRLYRLAESAALLEQAADDDDDPQVRRVAASTARQIRQALVELDAALSRLFARRPL